MKESLVPNKPEGKWAIEAFDFLRLFRRIGKTFLGLLFLEIGWTAYVLLLNKIIGGNPNPASLHIPVWFRSQTRLLIVFNGPTLLVLGSVLILVSWVFYSGFYLYLWAIIWHVLRRIILVLIYGIGFVLSLLNALLLPITWPLEIRWLGQWKLQHSAQLRTMQRRAIRELRNTKQSWRDNKIQIKQHLDQKIQGNLSRDRWIIIAAVAPAIGNILMRLYSFGAIGFAPLASYSYEEDLQAAKVPVQIFAWAIAKARIQLRGLEALDWIRFKFLPVHFLITTPEKAEFIRRLFELDVLLWGSYSTGDENVIWLNIQQRLRKHKSDQRASQESSNEIALFPLSLELDAPAVTLSQDDPQEAQTLLLVVIILILQGRWDTNGESRLKDFDRLYLLHHKLPEILNKLVYDAFLSITEKRLSKDFLPPTNVVLTQIIGQWVGYQLNTRPSSLVTTRSLEHLQSIAKRCAELMPDRAEHHYRLGSYKCLIDDKAGARNCFRKAQEIEARGREVDASMDQALFDLALDDAERETGIKQRFALARSVAHAARALNNRNDYTLENLKEKLAAHALLKYADVRTELEVIQDLLKE